MRIAVIVNQGAGAVAAGRVSTEGLRRSFLGMGTDAEVQVIPGEGISEAARAAVAAGVDAVVAGGGDGTVRSVAAVLAGGPVPLGVLPLGTLNHFARDLRIPTELEEAIRLIPRGEVRALDLGEVNGEVFVNNSELGFYPPVVRLRDRERRELDRGKWLATASALLKVLPGLHSLHVRVQADGQVTDWRTHFIFVGNNEYEMSAFSYGARHRFDSGSLYLYIAKTNTRLGIVGLVLLGLFKDVARTDHFERWCLPEFTVETRMTTLPVYFDGEVRVMRPPLRYRTRPLDLRVVVPPG
ncbi:MAG TPA: diacylglycerol kinase family protein [Thermoanaerobaculia bacterium]|jgi:diacylglycerol kinase family enzyme|nr:diacylglycerol kinase family protein [Thermoanaerobaculia bacterium]